MLAGALGPWVNAGPITFSGWAGIGLPLAIVALLALVLVVLHAAVRRRGWLVLNLFLGALGLIAAIVIWLLEGLISRAGYLLSLLVAHGTHRELFGPGHPVSLSWGIPMMGVSAAALMAVSAIGSFGRYPESSLPAFLQRRRRADPDLAEPPTPEIDTDESSWFSTR